MGSILLFLGRELNFLFAGGYGGLDRPRLTVPSLPSSWPAWGDSPLWSAMAVLAARHFRSSMNAPGYIVCGFLAGRIRIRLSI